MAVAKANNVRSIPSLRFRLEGRQVQGRLPSGREGEFEVVGITWLGEDPASADELLGSRENRTALAEAAAVNVVPVLPGIARPFRCPNPSKKAPHRGRRMRPSTDYTQLHAQDIKGEGPPKSSEPQQRSHNLCRVRTAAKLAKYVERR